MLSLYYAKKLVDIISYACETCLISGRNQNHQTEFIQIHIEMYRYNVSDNGHTHPCFALINSSPPSAACMHQRTRLELVKVMACRLFGAKPLPEPMLDYCQPDSYEQISVNFKSELYHFHSKNCIWNCRLPKWRPFCPGGRWWTSSQIFWTHVFISPAPADQFTVHTEFHVFIE